ncbi:hypothetical protein [Enterobacter phage 04_vB_Eclo_IJM]|nr:hypothetical protein [Enterobacter phage 04_vB_Eclo_IJM]
MSYLREGLTTAAIPSDQRATEVITQTVRTQSRSQVA